MEMEYKDSRRRGKIIVAVGVVLALAAGGGAFFLINNAQQMAASGSASVETVAVVVAVQPIAARSVIEEADVEVRQIPLDATNAVAVVSTTDKVIGRIPTVSILPGQMVTTNLLGSADGGPFAILGPEETVGPDSIAWRAVSITVSEDRAVGGLITPNQTVDLIMTATINPPQDIINAGKYYPDKSTKITYQNVLVLARTGAFYILKAPLALAEEITHLQASGNVQFSMVLRPSQDVRIADASLLGATTNVLIQRYGLLIPEVYPPNGLPLPTRPPDPTPFSTQPAESPAADASAAPGASLAPGGSPTPTPAP